MDTFNATQRYTAFTTVVYLYKTLVIHKIKNATVYTVVATKRSSPPPRCFILSGVCVRPSSVGKLRKELQYPRISNSNGSLFPTSATRCMESRHKRRALITQLIAPPFHSTIFPSETVPSWPSGFTVTAQSIRSYLLSNLLPMKQALFKNYHYSGSWS